jgi:hypothetical protein
MTEKAKLIAGIILITIPTIQYGGYFLFRILSGRTTLALTDFQKSMFRAGHAHAGVLVILALVAQLLIDHISTSPATEMFLRLGFPAAAILVSGGFFASAGGKGRTSPNSMVFILYLGVVILAIAAIYLGVSLIVSTTGY